MNVLANKKGYDPRPEEVERVEVGFLLAVLNGEYTIDDLLEERQRHLGRWYWKVPSKQLEAFKAATDAHPQQLRSCIDEWIDSGFGKDGETPDGRSLYFGAPTALKIAQSYIKRHPPRMSFSELGAAKFSFSQMSWRNLNPFSEVKEDAARMLASLFASSWKNTICKCRYCEQYFQIANPTRTYKRGTFCSRRCNSRASANEITSRKRETRKGTLLQSLARAEKRWNETPSRRLSKTEWLAHEVNKDIDDQTESRVTGKWVTRNLKPLEQRKGNGRVRTAAQRPRLSR
jgi:hypothetical protein